ncbi:MAG: hypothetical protein KJ578_04585 [Bacteroidetes bacterium]|nr:hypothetical protein [Bacteroidota bacterium]MBU2464803.1 hypothetical protein [Bacteroidota bacterium]MBU2557041.1 hypothetical protein [Bacteroidota bacterium]
MNIIQKQAADFYQMNMREGRTKHQAFIDVVKSELYNYRKQAHKMEFLQWILSKLKMDFDSHYEECENKENCQINETYENSLFFLQIELEEIEASLSENDFTSLAKTEMDLKLNEILDQMKTVQLGQQITYDDIKSEIEELKDFYFLNKKNWKQLLLGKLEDFTVAGIVAEKISKPLLELLKQF